MGIFNVLAFYFFALHADPHYSLLSMTSYMMTPQYSSVAYSNGCRGYETSLAVSVSAASVGSVVAQGNLYISEKAVFSKNIFQASVLSYNNSWGFSAGAGRFIYAGRVLESSASFSYYSFYDLFDKYSFYSGSARIAVPFSWGPHIHPFACIDASYSIYSLPQEISADLIRGFGLKLTAGTTVNFGSTALTLSGSINNAMLGANMSLSFSAK